MVWNILIFNSLHCLLFVYWNLYFNELAHVNFMKTVTSDILKKRKCLVFCGTQSWFNHRPECHRANIILHSNQLITDKTWINILFYTRTLKWWPVSNQASHVETVFLDTWGCDIWGLHSDEISSCSLVGCNTIPRVKVESACPSEMLVSYHITKWHYNSEDHNLNARLLCYF